MIHVMMERPPASSITEALSFLFEDANPETITTLRRELIRNHRFFNEINAKFVEKRNRRLHCEGCREFLYLVIRFRKPNVVLETGVFDGTSSAVILQALCDNGSGTLVSVDLPAAEKAIPLSTDTMRETTLPPHCQPGWIVPDYLRERYRLVLGDSKSMLPQLLEEYSTIDIFLHDSLHSFEHQYWEYTTAWPYLSKGGLLLSDDIFWSPAFHRFCREKRRPYVYLARVGAVKGGFGAARK
jgi:predicted O-methyltransferase YrrM